jgi:hypothetical protein
MRDRRSRIALRSIRATRAHFFASDHDTPTARLNQ